MDGSNMRHLIRRNGTYYFRYVLPTTLTKQLQASEIKFTLNTYSKPYAKQLAAQCYVRVCTLPAMGFTSLAQAVEYVKAIPILMDKLTPLTTLLTRSDAGSLQQAFRVLNGNNYPVFVKLPGLNDFAYHASKLNNQGVYLPIRLDKHPDTIIVPYFDGQIELRSAFINDNTLINFTVPYTVHLHQLQVKELPDDMVAQLRTITPPVATSAPAIPDSPLLSVEFLKFKELKKPSWSSPKTVDEYDSVIGLLIEIIGDKPVLTLCNDDYDKFVITIRKLPPNRKTNPKIKGKSLDEILTMGLPSMSDRTIQKYHNRCVAFIGWLKTRYKDLHIHPALPKVKLKVSEQRKRKRQPFNDDQLAIIFSSPESLVYLATQKEPHKVWLPLLGLLQGVRINEAAQLKLSDVKDEAPIPYISISDDGEHQGVKGEASVRSIPIHQKLIELSFIDYVRYLRSLPERKTDGRLFGNLKNKPEEGRNYGHQASQWFGNFLDKLGITEKQVTYHSFRHTVHMLLRRADQADWRINRFQGWSQDDDDSSEGVASYMNDITVKDLVPCVEAIQYPNLDLSGFAELCRKTFK